MAYEALYRRYRPGRFDEVAGQEHVVAALRNAVRDGRVGHAYLFSGPRGTGKTSSARILAKALNCTNLQDGEPCNECDSCQAFLTGSSYDLHELDAASNNGVEAMRDLIQKVALGSPGQAKVYVLDEVHMLSTGAENALLKTLEEPPSHVTFVLCTTEPNKVVPTIRSRTQHLEFNLLPAEQVDALVRTIAADAELDVTDEDITFVIRAGGGSARDTLSALDQVVAAGGAPQDHNYTLELIAALGAGDTGRALVAVNDATRSGRDPAIIGTAVLAELRNAFLTMMGANVSHLSDADRAAAASSAEQLSPARITRALEVLGTALVDMRQAPDPRVDLEVALVRLTRPGLDTSPAALVERIERLEQGAPVVAPGPAATPAIPTPDPGAPSHPDEGAPPASGPDGSTEMSPAPSPQVQESAQTPESPQAQPRAAGPASAARQVLAKSNRQRPPDDQPPPQAPQPQPEAASSPPGSAPLAAESAPSEAASGSKPTLGSLRRAAAAAAAAPAEPGLAPGAEVGAAASVVDEDHPTSPQAPSSEAPPLDHAAPAEAPVDTAESLPHTSDATPPIAQPTSTVADGSLPTLDEVSSVWSSEILANLSGRVKSRFSAGTFLPSTAESLVFALPNSVHMQRCEEVRAEVDEAIAAQFGRPVPLQLAVDDGANNPPEQGSTDEPPEDESIDLDDLRDATGVDDTGLERLMQAFEGSELVDPD